MKWLNVNLKLTDKLILSLTVAVASVGLATKRRASMQTQDTAGTNETTQKFQRSILSTSLVGGDIQVTVKNGIIEATLQNYDRFNHTFQARLEDMSEAVFPASTLFCPGKCS
jgi:hypothetical protein